jgi:hypothetical protein
MYQPITINGVAVELEVGMDWKGRDVYFANVAGQRKSFYTAWGAVAWAAEAIKRLHRLQAVSSITAA